MATESPNHAMLLTLSRMVGAVASSRIAGAGAIGPALQSIGVSQGYYLFAAVPYVLTLVILIISCRPGSVARGSPACSPRTSRMTAISGRPILRHASRLRSRPSSMR